MKPQTISFDIEFENHPSYGLTTCDYKVRDILFTDIQRTMTAEPLIEATKKVLRKMENWTMITITAYYQEQNHFAFDERKIIKSKRYLKEYDHKREGDKITWSLLRDNRFGQERFGDNGWNEVDKLNLTEDIKEYVEACNHHMLTVLTEAAYKTA